MIRTLALLVVTACGRGADEAPEIQYDHEACDNCGMLVSDPAHAAALVADDGKTFSFDDPGCLFEFVVKHPAHYTHMWFSDGQRWYTEAEVGFSVGASTPMGSGLHAVPLGTAGALSVGEASSRVVGR